MVGSLAANSDTYIVTTPSNEEIRLTRLFNAPRALVFDAMTKPEHVRQWWGLLGDGYSVAACEIDLRVGGKWKFVSQHPKGEITFYGEYQEIVRPSRLAFTEIFADYPDSVSVVSTDYTEEGHRTRLTATVKYPSREIRDMVIKSGMSKGAGISYDRLEDLLARLQRS